MKLEAVVTPPVDPPVPPSVTVKHVIEISDTGDLTIDNIPYV
jgi:hypothetical protein